MSGILPFYRLKLVDSTQLELKRMLRQQGELKSFTAVLAAHQSQAAGVGCQSGTIPRRAACYYPYMSNGPFR